MKIMTNGDKQTLEQENISVSELLKVHEVELPEMVSVQLNGEFVARETYDETIVKDGDEVDFLYLMGGGSPR
jgi:sulfur carrier protein